MAPEQWIEAVCALCARLASGGPVSTDSLSLALFELNACFVETSLHQVENVFRHLPEKGLAEAAEQVSDDILAGRDGWGSGCAAIESVSLAEVVWAAAVRIRAIDLFPNCILRTGSLPCFPRHCSKFPAGVG